MYTAVHPETIEQIIARVATLARSRGNDLGPLDMSQMQQAYYEVNGYQPDEEGTQLLLRLPGLAALSSSPGNPEARIFVDRDLASVAYGEDLAQFVSNPYDQRHPLAAPSSWVTAATDLSIEVASIALTETNRRAVLAVADRRQDSGYFDAVLADLIALSDHASGDAKSNRFQVEGVLFEQLSPGNAKDTLASVNLSNCVIDTLDISTVTSIDEMPTISSTLIGYLDGAEAIPAWLADRFVGVEIESYAQASATTAGILRLDIEDDVAVALTILKKIYRQRGSGRKEQALYRGLDQTRRGLASDVIQRLVSRGWLVKHGTGDRVQYLPVKDRRTEAKKMLETPSTFVW